MTRKPLDFMSSPLNAPEAPPQRRSGFLALTFTLVYLVIFTVFVVLATRRGLFNGGDRGHLDPSLLVEGLDLVVITGVAFFLTVYWLLRRLERQDAEIARHQEAMMGSERAAMAGIFAASIAHDINNVLVILNADVDALRDKHALSPEQEELARHIRKAVDRINALARRLSEIEKEGSLGEAGPVQIGDVIRETLELVGQHALVKSCTLETHPAPGPITLQANSALLARAIMNLVLNAAQATGPGGRIEVRARSEAGNAVIEVHDDGPGLPAENRERAFEPFVTSRAGGTGLGLLTVKVCARQHRGRVEIHDSPLGGACFRMTLSLAAADATQPRGVSSLTPA